MFESLTTRLSSVFDRLKRRGALSEADVAEAVWTAANDLTGRLHFPAGADAVALARAG